MEYDNCPHCGVSLIGEEIPEQLQGVCGATHYKREIGLEYVGVYDGVVAWRCPDCQKEWPSIVGKMIEREGGFNK